MTPLKALVKRRTCGVYRWRGSAADVAAMLGTTGPTVVALTVPATRERLLGQLASELHFPDWFGGNWDAFEECLGDLETARTPGLVLALDGLDRLAEQDADAVRTFVEIARDATESWRKRGGHLLLLAAGAQQLLADLEEAGP